MPIFSESLLYLVSFIGTCGTGVASGAAAAVGRTAWNKVSKEEARQEQLVAMQANMNENLNKLVMLQTIQANREIDSLPESSPNTG